MSHYTEESLRLVVLSMVLWDEMNGDKYRFYEFRSWWGLPYCTLCQQFVLHPKCEKPGHRVLDLMPVSEQVARDWVRRKLYAVAG